MLEPDGSPNTAHSLNPVPFVVTVAGIELADGGVLADVAPTALALLGIEQPAAMTGRSLLVGSERSSDRRAVRPTGRGCASCCRGSCTWRRPR